VNVPPMSVPIENGPLLTVLLRRLAPPIPPIVELEFIVGF
jgi:hypothetical protein